MSAKHNRRTFANAGNIFRNTIPHIYIAESEGKGRGVFAARPLRKGEQIEVCPMLVLSNDDMQLIEQTKLYNYYFLWGDDSSKGAIALGFGSLYNHSYEANARYEVEYSDEIMTLYAHRDIEAGEEIFINYNGVPNDQTPVWFDKRKKKE